jgi:uncharacterized protein YbaR (Trm112 family)
VSERITCPRCRGTVSTPIAPTQSVVCPFCHQFLKAIDPKTGASWMPRRKWTKETRLYVVVAAVILHFLIIGWLAGKQSRSTADALFGWSVILTCALPFFVWPWIANGRNQGD